VSGPAGYSPGGGGRAGGRPWWEDAVFYQVYPRSFMDADGDGTGDLAGIAARLDHVASLGVDALWISPFFPSPMRDFGYDVADYRGVDPVFGSLEDFDRLVAAARVRGIRIVLDLVANHSSDEHPWFVEARASKASPRHGWYLWVPDTGRPPNNWKALFELGSAWHPNPATGERYLGTFTRHQPEFDWRNPELRREFLDTMRWWYARGVDGFRLDVATAYLKDEGLRSNPFSPVAIPDFFQRHIHDRNLPEVAGIFREMRAAADEAGEKVLIGEPHGQDIALSASCLGQSGDGLHLAFDFDFMNQPWRAESFRAAAERWYAALPGGAWPCFSLSNHDKPRHAFRYRARDPRVTEARARVAAAMLLTLRGTPFLYYGEEIGMGCFRLPRRALRDPLGIATWPLGFLGRDRERSPMQWDGRPGAGFSPAGAKPWLPLNPDWTKRNVAAQEADPTSLLSWYRSLLALRRAEPALRHGDIGFLGAGPGVLAWERGGSVLVALNFRSRRGRLALSRGGRVLLGSARAAGGRFGSGELELGPDEVLVASLD